MLFTPYTSEFLRVMSPVFEDAKTCEDEVIRNLQMDTLKTLLVRFDKTQREWVRKEVERQ